VPGGPCPAGIGVVERTRRTHQGVSLATCTRRPHAKSPWALFRFAMTSMLRVMGDRGLANRVRMGEASGMVSIQAHCSVTEAIALMRRRAEISGATLDEVVIAVVDRSIRFGV
jgi:hypothetical protein